MSINHILPGRRAILMAACVILILLFGWQSDSLGIPSPSFARSRPSSLKDDINNSTLGVSTAPQAPHPVEQDG